MTFTKTRALIALLFVAFIAALVNLEVVYLFQLFNKQSEDTEKKQAEIFIIETRRKWSLIQDEFIRNKKLVYVAQSAKMSNVKNMEKSACEQLDGLLKMTTTYNFKDDKNKQLAVNVNILIKNATKELEHGIGTDSEAEYEVLIKNANTEIELANKNFLEIVERNGFEDIKPLSKVDGRMI